MSGGHTLHSGHGALPPGPRPPRPPVQTGEVLRIAASMIVTCLLGGVILGAVYVATDRYAQEARVRNERTAIAQMLDLDSTATVLEVRQYLVPDSEQVVYRTEPPDGSRGVELRFTLDGRLTGRSDVAAGADPEKGWKALGRLFVARRDGAMAGFVIEGETQGYKNRIRFFVALDDSFRIAGVRVVEHEEDPGLGAEVATSWFQGQYIGRPAADLPALEVTRDPMPEDWRSALRARDRMGRDAWRAHYAALLAREDRRPVYAVTGATISSRALTDGVRAAVGHFQRRWDLLSPYLGGRT
jgi:electron transport complex protein RnfG